MLHNSISVCRWLHILEVPDLILGLVNANVWPVSLLVLSQPFELVGLRSNSAGSTGFNQVITVDRLLTYSCLLLQIDFSAPKYDE